MDERIFTFEQAFSTVLDHARLLSPAGPPEPLPLLESTGRVLAEPVLADRDQPPFDRSTRDGFALRSSEIRQPLRVIATLRAGQPPLPTPLAPGEALEIMTGAPLPAGADAVVMVEHTTQTGGLLHIDPARTLRPGENIVPQGAEARIGSEILPAGTLITPAEVALAASCGYATLRVHPRPRVAILATGDELVDLTTPPAPHQIRNSNTYALAALVAAEGALPLPQPVARDTPEDLHRRIAEATTHADLLLLSGGVSMGKYDFVEQVLTHHFAADFLFTGALIQPGKPVVFARLAPATGPLYAFGLPGNPVSTQITFHLFVAPLLRALAGRRDILPRVVQAHLAAEVPGPARVTRFLPAELTADWHSATVRPIPWQGSGDLAANARANAYIIIPSGSPPIPAGQTVPVLLR